MVIFLKILVLKLTIFDNYFIYLQSQSKSNTIFDQINVSTEPACIEMLTYTKNTYLIVNFF